MTPCLRVTSKEHFQMHWEINYSEHVKLCDLNDSVRGRVSSPRTRFWTLPNLNSEVSEPKILLFSYWFLKKLGIGHFQTLIWKCPTVQFSQIFPLFLIFGS